ncbi:MAG: GTA-gp10 family protein [Devosiaceae bacterium]
MANPYRGEATLRVADHTYTLRLTLGALAALEAHFKAADLAALINQLLAACYTSADLALVLEEALVAGGDVSRQEAQTLLAQAGKPLDLGHAYVALMQATFRS